MSTYRYSFSEEEMFDLLMWAQAGMPRITLPQHERSWRIEGLEPFEGSKTEVTRTILNRFHKDQVRP